MKFRSLARHIATSDWLNFTLTNRIPRSALTRLMGRFSKIEQPLVRDASIALWRMFADLDLSDARKTSFHSLHDCFIRELKSGARPVDPHPDVLVSPCDAIVGACGRVDAGTAVQAKGRHYSLAELFGDAALAGHFTAGTYVTLRLTSSMYHRFHAPYDCEVGDVAFFPGDAWNVNPPTLARIDRVFCRNERAVVRTRLQRGRWPVVLVPVAAVLVASLRFNFVDPLLNPAYRGPYEFECNARFDKGAEMGWFEHGSTILVFAPPGFTLAGDIVEGAFVRMGRALMHLPSA